MTYRDRAGQAGEEWAAVRPDVPTQGMVLSGRLAELTHLIASHHDQPLFDRFGLKSGEFDVLATLRRAGEPGGLTPTALYAATMVSSGGMTNRIDRLAALGLVERRPHPDDRRGTLVALTPAGRDVIDRLITAHAQNRERITAMLSEDEKAQLCALLARMIVGLDPQAPGFVGGPESLSKAL